MRTKTIGVRAVAAMAALSGFGLAAGDARAQGEVGAAEASDSGTLQEITVTAQRRVESVQKSSVAIEVVGAERLQSAGVSQATDLSNTVPGLAVSVGGTSVQTFLRGVGTFATDASAESSIAYNINGVYISRPAGIGPIFYDLTRVEVLKGPQGTLYGRNASGGAINLITNRPTHEWGGNIAVEGGNESLRKATAVLNAPVSETFALRLAGQTVDHDGYLTDGYNDQKTRAGRLIALWDPSEKFSVQFMGEYANVGGQGEGIVRRSVLQPSTGDEWKGASEASEQPPSAFIPGGTRILPDGVTDNEIRAYSAEVNWQLPFATLTFIPALRNTHIDYFNYTPGFRFQDHETSEQTSYELRLGNSSSRMNWVGGFFYFDEDQTELYRLNANPFQASIVDIALSNESWAAFGQANFNLNEKLRLIAGARYTDEKKTQTGFTTTVLPAPGTTNNAGARTFTDTSWKGGVEYDLAPDSMLFLTVGTGFKAGGFFPSVLAPNNAYEPEQLLAYTLGSRNRFADNRLQLNVETFYWKYDDKQERFLGATPSGATGLLTTNAGKATIYGANVDVQWAATSHDRLRLSAEYLHSVYDEFTYTAFNPTGGSYPQQATSCVLGAPASLPSTPNPIDTQQSINCDGKQLVKAPEWSGSAGYEHTFGLSGGGEFVAGVNGTFASKQFLTTDFIESGVDDGYALLNADLTFYSSDRHWSIGAWGRNLTNEAIYTAGFRYPYSRPVVAGGDPTLMYAPIRAPRTYGLRASYEF